MLASTPVPTLRASTSCGSIVFEWSQSSSQLQLQYKDSYGQWKNVVNWNQNTQAASQFKLDEIAPGQQLVSGVSYTFRLANQGSCGVSTSLETTIAVPVGDKPTLIAQPTCDGVAINWTAPSGSSQLLYKERNSQTWLNVDSWTQRTTSSSSVIQSFTVTTLSNGQPIGSGKYY